jgi:alpha-galactosidase
MGTPTKFPSGMKGVADQVHAAGAQFGVYSAASERTCGNWSASLFNEARDAATFASWGVDFLKYDACIYSGGVQGRARYGAMSRALNATGRRMFYSVEGWSPTQGDWGPEVANMWRTGNDIWPDWDGCILNNLYQTNIAAPYNRYSMQASHTLKDHAGGGFNDGDMLQPPNTLITERKPGLSLEESSSQFKLWAIMKVITCVCIPRATCCASVEETWR